MLGTIFAAIAACLTHPVGFLLGVLIVGWWYNKKKYSYFKNLGIPGPEPIPFFGNAIEMLSTPMCKVQMKNIKKYGPIYGLYFGYRREYVIAEPELIKQLLVKDFQKFTDRFEWKANQPTWDLMLFAADGEDWKRLRALSSPTFTSGKMKKMYHLVRECTDLLVEAVGKIASEKNEVDLKKVFANLTMDAICRCAFATKTNTHSDPNNILVSTSYRFINISLMDQLNMLAYITLPSLRKLLGLTFVNPKTMYKFDKIIKEITSQRKQQKGGQKPNDFLQLMIDSTGNDEKEQDEGDNGVDSESHHVNDYKETSMASSSATKRPLTEAELIAQCFIFIVAGYETTSSLLSYFFYSLAINEDCQEKLVEEIKESEDENGEIDYETLAKMPYLDACISEALRLYSPVVILERKPNEDTKLGDIMIHKDMSVLVPVFAIHHNEKYYPDPYRFNPDRFLPENRHKLVPYTYLPFGAGPRNCIGLRFALMETKLATVRMLRKFRFTRINKTHIPLEFKTGHGILLQCRDITVGVEKR